MSPVGFFAATCMFALVAATVTIDPFTTLWVVHPIDAGFAARTPLALALRDLQIDYYKVLGIRPAVIVGTDKIPAGFNGTSIYFGEAASSRVRPSSTHDEAHAIVLAGNDIFLTGNSERAEVYAAYAFSERVLGVEPMWWWVDSEPVYKGTLVLREEDVAVEFGAPVFHWRGWFPNDEDLLGNWKPDPLGQSMFSTETWNRIAEALLRLKGNLIIAGTVSFPDEMHFDLLRRRGVVVTMQHFTLLGVNTWRWPKGIPYSFDQNPEIQEFVWQACLAAYAGRDAVWTIGTQITHITHALVSSFPHHIHTCQIIIDSQATVD
jgi:hypothetical protein